MAPSGALCVSRVQENSTMNFLQYLFQKLVAPLLSEQEVE